jgi:hypothetical protein
MTTSMYDESELYFFYAQLIALCGTLDFEPVEVTR